ncbi:MAG: helix-turn-helix domain-containing protein [Candidatus Nanohaloarchaea archaeon]|nr:helix-turn-helix domain-containing protein [Candidatus Nanohaloarchaea archaeon]
MAFVQNSVNRERVLRKLLAAGRPMTPTELSDDLGIVVKTASRAVRQLHDHGLVDCRNPDAPRDRRYQPTEQGRTVVSRLEDVEDRPSVERAEPVLAESPLEYGDDSSEPVGETQLFVARSENRTAVLRRLDETGTPLTPSEIADDLEIGFNSASRALQQLAGEGLVECVTPDAERYRRYTVTGEGAEVLAELGA